MAIGTTKRAGDVRPRDRPPQTAMAAGVNATKGWDVAAETPTRETELQDPAHQRIGPVADDPTRRERRLAGGSRQCRCGGCGRHFGGAAAFDRH
jgi:hypothetical protein